VASRHEGQSIDAGTGAETPVIGLKSCNGIGPKGVVIRLQSVGNPQGRTDMNEAKPFCITKRDVWEAYKQVKANKGAAGSMDNRSRTLKGFEK